MNTSDSKNIAWAMIIGAMWIGGTLGHNDTAMYGAVMLTFVAFLGELK